MDDDLNLPDRFATQAASGGYVVTERALGCRSVHQLDFVDDDSRLKRIPFGDHQEPVEHSAVRLWLRCGEDDDHLIDVGGDDALALPFTGFASSEL